METCEKCGCEVTDLITVATGWCETEEWCEECVKNHTTQCDECGKVVASYRMRWLDSFNRHVCFECFSSKYDHCERCGNVVEIDNMYEYKGYYYCQKCYEDVQFGSFIFDYHDYDDSIEFVPQGTPAEAKLYEIGEDIQTYGVELEISGGGINGRKALDIVKAAGWHMDRGDEMLICSEDGSIGPGFEIISQPLTLEAHRQLIDWEALMKRAKELGYTSHDNGKCGLHIHCGRVFFDKEDDTIDQAFSLLFSNNEQWLKDFSRRDGKYNYCHFHHSLDGKYNLYVDQKGLYAPFLDYSCLQNDKIDNQDKYSAVNIGRSDTVEFRLFRGTLKYSTFVAALQLCDIFCTIVKDMDLPEISRIDLQWCRDYAQEKNYVEFLNYLEERNIAG